MAQVVHIGGDVRAVAVVACDISRSELSQERDRSSVGAY